MKILSTVLNFKGHNSIKNVGGVTVLFFSAHRLMVVYICAKFHENIFNGIKVLERIRFHRKNSKG